MSQEEQLIPDYEEENSNYVGENDYIHNSSSYDDFKFQRSTTINMNNLFEYFHKSGSQPKYYRGIAKRVAICKCPKTDEEEWFNGERCLSIENPEKGEIITVTLNIKGKIYKRDFVFMGWVKTKVHEWVMTNGTMLQLEEKFIEALCAKDKRYLKMNR
jgi:hypothetical protein